MTGADKEPGRKTGEQDSASIRRRLSDLEGKLGQVRARHAQPQDTGSSDRGAAIGTALKLATELVAGVIVGGCIGWTLDYLFGTKPWMMLVFLILGSAAGILNVIRSASAMQKKRGSYPGTDLPPEDEDE